MDGTKHRLSKKHWEFLGLMEKGLPEMEAARAVWKTGGYVGSRRYRDNPKVVAEIERIQALFKDEARVSRQDVINGLLTAVNHAQLTADSSSQTRAWVELAKLHGYYEPEKKITEHVLKIEKQLEELTTDELINMSGVGVITLDKMAYKVEEVEVEATEPPEVR